MATQSPAPPVAPAPPKPGVYRGLSRAEYKALPAVNFHTIVHYRRSAQHVRQAMLVPSEPTPAMRFGAAMHVAVLEPDQFPARYATIPEGAPPRRKEIDKRWWAEFEAANASKEILTVDEWGRLMACQRAAWARGGAFSAILGAPGMREVVIVWLDTETGLLCKAQIDALVNLDGQTFLADLKTARNAHPESFRKDVANFDYHGQLAWYRMGLNALAPRERRPVLLAIESEEPYASAVYELDTDALQAGLKRVRRWLTEHATCVKTGIWPGYQDALITLPAWAFREVD